MAQAQAQAQLCLVMIVKNEEHVIERSLKSILPFVDTWCIVDTGSTDSTMQKIKEITDKHEKPGTLHERPWVNFGHNRTELLEIARKDTESKDTNNWFFMLDADDIVETKTPFKHFLSKGIDAYHLVLKRGSLTYKRPVIFNTRAWVFKGALHEYAHLDNARHGDLPNVTIDARVEGARSRNPHKYRDDALALETDFQTNPDPRSAFYCAQSWRDSGNIQKATEWYLKRASMGGWPQEVYVSYLNLIRLSTNTEEKFKYAWASLDAAPRLEAVQQLLEHLRQRGIWSQQAYAIGIQAANSAKPGDHLFAEEGLIPKFYDELSIHSFYTGHHESCILYGAKAYFTSEPMNRPRILANMKFGVDKLGG